MGKPFNMTFASSLTNLSEVNSSFDQGVLRICYTGENQNRSYISREAIERNIASIYNCPVVCNYDRETDTLGGHDVQVVQSSTGDYELVNLTDPVGVIPESAKVWFDDYTGDDGISHEYLYADVLLWKRQEAYKKIKEDGITAQSMEIDVRSGRFADGIQYIDDFQFTAFALIGVAPCFPDAALEVYSEDRFKEQYSEMMQELKETFKTVKPSNEDDNTHPENYTEGGEGVLDSKKELIAKYGIDESTLDFSIDDFTVEELEEKFKAMAENTSPEAKPEDDPVDKFALLSNIKDEIYAQLDTQKIQTDWGEHSKYYYADADLDTKEVYCWDSQDWNLYGFTYQANGDHITIDFANPVRKKYEIVDFDEGDQPSPFGDVYSQMTEAYQKVSQKLQDSLAYEEKYQSASETIKSMQSELDELRTYKANIEDASAEQEREALFAQFEDLNGIETFEALRENCKDYDMDTLEEKCFAIRGRASTVSGTLKFSANNITPKLKVPETQDKEDSYEPYGGLLAKYAEHAE